MLDKIININSDVRLKSNTKKNLSERYGQKMNSVEDQDKDSLIFSPAASYLAVLEWELHNLNYTGEDKILIEFVIQNIFFRFSLDFSKYYSSKTQTIFISKKINKKNISALMKLSKRKLWFIDHYEKITFTALETFFEEVSKMDIIEIYDNSPELDALNNTLELKLNSELQYILAAVFTFIDKLGKFNIVKKFDFNNDSSELVKFEKVMVKNA